jgi:sulfatase maturation enzyme AslB (radical SAM superfamily)
MKWTCCISSSPEQLKNREKINSFTEKNNSLYIIKLQNDLASGIRSKLCDTCWGQEDAGLTSPRMSSIAGKSDEVLINEIKNKKLTHLWIDSGNVCNLSCRMCGPYASTSLRPEYKKRKELHPDFVFHQQDEPIVSTTPFESLLNEDYSELLSLQVLGGEPLLNLDHVAVLEHIANQGNGKNCEVRYVTNGTQAIPKSIIDIIPKFKQVIFTYSIDAVGDKFNYIRTGKLWENVAKNIEYRLTSNGQDLGDYDFHITVGILNVLYLDELLEWLSKHNKRYVLYPIAMPMHYAFNALTESEKFYIIDKLSNSKFDLSTIINYVAQSKFDPTVRSQFFTELAWNKEYKGMDANDYLPELMSLLNGKAT